MDNITKHRHLKKCSVSSCTNTSISTPNKRFFNVPHNNELRRKWRIALQKDLPNKASYCCEDHFNLPEDTENWIRYKLQNNVKLRLKPGAVPHKVNISEKITAKQMAALKLTQKRLVEEALADAEKKDRLTAREGARQKELASNFYRNLSFETVLINVDNISADNFSVEESHEVRPRAAKCLGISRGVQTRQSFRSKAVTCSLKIPRPRGRKRKKWHRKAKNPPYEMTVYEDSDSEDFEEVTSSQVEETNLNSYDKAVQVSLKSYHNKGTSCSIPVDSRFAVKIKSPVKKNRSSISKVAFTNTIDPDWQERQRSNVRVTSETSAYDGPRYEKPAILRRAQIKRHSDNVSPKSLVPQPSISDENFYDKATHLFSTSPDITLSLTDPLFNQPEPTFYCTNNTTEFSTEHLSGSNSPFVLVMNPNNLNFIQSQPYIVLNMQSQSLAPSGHCEPQGKLTDQHCQVLNLEPSEKCKNSPKKVIKEEIVNEDYKEGDLLPLAQIKREMEDYDDEFYPANFVECSIKPEPYFDESADFS